MADMTRVYRDTARRLVINKGRMTPTEIYKEIGRPPEGIRLKADGKGNVTTEQVKNRRARRNRANAKRAADAKMSRPSLTPEEKREKSKLEKQRTKERAEGKDTEILHKQRPSLTGPQLGRLKGRQRAKIRKKLEGAYGRLGDSPENTELGSGADNRQEEVDYGRSQRRLGEMEEQRPSDPRNPSANYFKTSDNGETNGNGSNGAIKINGNGSNGGRSNGGNGYSSYGRNAHMNASQALKIITTTGAIGLAVMGEIARPMLPFAKY